MVIQVKSKWKQDVEAAWRQSQEADRLHRFCCFKDKEQRIRASFFSEMAEVIEKLGLSNPHEKAALSLEPTHPVPPIAIAEAFRKLRLPHVVTKVRSSAKLSLISLALLEKYSADSDAKLMRSAFKAPLYLLDPLYGFVFYPHGDRIRNHCFAIDVWSRHLSSMPVALAEELWKTRADSLFSGGAYAGRLLFQEMIPQETDPIKRSVPPELCVNSEKELFNVIDKLKKLAERHKNVQLWFRGQRRDYLTPDRRSLTSIGITPYSNVRDSDLTPSLYRTYDTLLADIKSFEDMIIELAEWVYLANSLLPRDLSPKAAAPTKGAASVQDEGITSYQRGLLLQQYGAPSAYLDITSDPEVSAWFATHECHTRKDGRLIFNRYSWNNPSPQTWPTIYVFPLVKGLHPFLDLESILSGTEALRPARQRCGLLGGAGNLARNYCSKFIGLKIRLAPDFKLSQPALASEMFPPPSEDRILKLLLDEGLGNSQRRFRASVVDEDHFSI